MKSLLKLGALAAVLSAGTLLHADAPAGFMATLGAKDGSTATVYYPDIVTYTYLNFQNDGTGVPDVDDVSNARLFCGDPTWLYFVKQGKNMKAVTVPDAYVVNNAAVPATVLYGGGASDFLCAEVQFDFTPAIAFWETLVTGELPGTETNPDLSSPPS
ncbi:MAG: hypothetical protein ABSH53_16670 [Holophaga sp.]|jgi:hypothetical protein